MRTLIALSTLITGILSTVVHPSAQAPIRSTQTTRVDIEQAKRITAERERAARPLIEPYINGTEGFAMKIKGTGKYLCARNFTEKGAKFNINYGTHYIEKRKGLRIEADGPSKDDSACQFTMTRAEEDPWVHLHLLKNHATLAKY